MPFHLIDYYGFVLHFSTFTAPPSWRRGSRVGRTAGQRKERYNESDPQHTCIVVLLLAITAPAAAGQQDFVLVNKVGFTIHQLFISPVGTDNWGEDVFGDKALPNNAQVPVAFPVDASKCHWDLKVVDENGGEAIFADLNLCNISKIILMIENGEATATLVE